MTVLCIIKSGCVSKKKLVKVNDILVLLSKCVISFFNSDASLACSVSPHTYLQEELLGDVHNLHGGLIHKALLDPTKVAHRQALLKLMSRALGLTEMKGNQRKDQQGLKEVEVYLLIAAC